MTPWRCWLRRPPRRPGPDSRWRRSRTVLARGGRRRNLERRAEEIAAVLATPGLHRPLRGGRGVLPDHPGDGGGDRRAQPPDQRARGRHWGNVLGSTRTPPSSSPCQGWVTSSAPGCSASSGTTPSVTPRSSLAGTTPAPRRSPSPRGRNGPWSPDGCATGVSVTPSTAGRSARCRPARDAGPSTTNGAPLATTTTRRSGPSATDWSASSTAASATAPPTERTSPGATAKPPTSTAA